MRMLAVSAILLSALSSSPALAGSSGWHETEGGRVRLVTARSPDADGVLRAALEIALDPGWKTYWRDPGDAGVPPSLDLSDSSGIGGVEIDFPAPERHDDGYTVWAGYDTPVSLPIRLTLIEQKQAPAIRAKVFLGICQSICVPVSATLDVPSTDDGTNADDAAVAAAFAALPQPATSTIGVTGVAASDKCLTVTAALPDDATDAELFLAGADGYVFGLAEPVRAIAGTATFSVPLYGRPKAAPTGSGVRYTLVWGGRSVSGTIGYP